MILAGTVPLRIRSKIVATLEAHLHFPRDVCAISQQDSKHFACHETDLIIRHQLKPIMAFKAKVKN